jgi:hypothetical protein
LDLWLWRNPALRGVVPGEIKIFYSGHTESDMLFHP